MPYAPDVYAEGSFSQGFLLTEYLNMEEDMDMPTPFSPTPFHADLR
jgi:hypothetical protein